MHWGLPSSRSRNTKRVRTASQQAASNISRNFSRCPSPSSLRGLLRWAKKRCLRCAFASLCDRVSFHGGRPYAGQSVYAHQERETSPRYRASGGRYQPDLAAALRSSQWRHAMRRPLKANKPQPDCCTVLHEDLDIGTDMVRGGLVAATLQVKPEEIRRFCQTAPTRLLRVEPGSLGRTRQCQARWRRAGVASASRGNHPACTSEARKVEETAFAREGQSPLDSSAMDHHRMAETRTCLSRAFLQRGSIAFRSDVDADGKASDLQLWLQGGGC